MQGTASYATHARAGIEITVVPGPSAVTAAVALSGLPSDSFTFHGFPPRKGTARAEFVNRLRRAGTHVLYESPQRLLATLTELGAALNDPEIALSREITKIHEETLRGRCSEVLAAFADRDVRGEVTLVVRTEPAERAGADPQALSRVLAMKRQLGLSAKDAASAAALLLDLPRKAVYDHLVKAGNT
ncbi:MAG: SAM-dependent methyltransferase [Deltaproteobacteria bacterium]|nr:SAM-dependent methyltransferase [Deltaproteobacteria bacterium]